MSKFLSLMVWYQAEHTKIHSLYYKHTIMENAQLDFLFDRIAGDESVAFEFDDGGNTQSIEAIAPSACMRACPAGVNVKAYVSLIASGRFAEAYQIVRQRNPLPGICGRVCTHPCEAFCNRNEVDAPVAIRALKRFVADYEMTHPSRLPRVPASKGQPKIAIIGSGPAGLTAANDLRLQGYQVTIFEALPEPGGMLVAGIPEFRLPRDILRHEIEAIKQLGVQIKTNTKIAGEQAIDGLFDSGYSAVFIATGAHKDVKLGIPGEDKFKGVLDAITFLRSFDFGKPVKLGKKVAVIGGGNSAIDAARSAVRLGVKDVTILYRRSRKEMPAGEIEILDAEEEGIEMQFLAAPVQIEGKSGRVTGVLCNRMRLGKPDDSGRRRPAAIPGETFLHPADTVIVAVSQQPDLTFIEKNQGFEFSKWQTFTVDEETLATPRQGVFAGGDAVTGPNTVIDAIAAGHLASQSIDRYLRQEPLVQETDSDKWELELKSDLKLHKKQHRTDPPRLEGSHRIKDFREVELCFTEHEAMAEARRCLRCGPCHECAVCTPECSKQVAILSCPGHTGEALLRLPDSSYLKRYPLVGTLHLNGGEPQEAHIQHMTSYVREELCRGCGECVSLCEYGAPVLIPRANGVFVSNIHPSICKGCGTCVTACPSGAISQYHYDADWFKERLGGIDADAKNTVIFACSWHDSDLQESLAMKTSNPIVIQTACAGRIEPATILQAFESGAQNVLIVGCADGHCHYGFGNRHAKEEFKKVQNILHLLGVTSERFRWVQVEPRETGLLQS